jgi:hypothetical protein
VRTPNPPYSLKRGQGYAPFAEGVPGRDILVGVPTSPAEAVPLADHALAEMRVVAHLPHPFGSRADALAIQIARLRDDLVAESRGGA